LKGGYVEDLVKITVQRTSKLYDGGNGTAFKKARESTLDSLGLERGSSNRHAVRSVASQNLSFRGNAVKQKKKRIKVFNELHGDLFPTA
jgi:hypothetical protein